MRLGRISAVIIAATIALDVAAEPFKLPLFDDDRPVPAVKPLRELPTNEIFDRIVGCWPDKSMFDITVEMQTGARWYQSVADSVSVDPANAARFYVGVVAKIPLYSPAERERELRYEQERRLTIADRIAALEQAFNEVRVAARLVGMYTALEARSQKRVVAGVAETSEQVGYLKSLVDAQKAYVQSRTELRQSILQLSSLCRDSERDSVRDWLTRMTKGD